MKLVKLEKYLYLSQALLLVSLLICSLIIPSVAIKNGGVSNYGNHLSTFGLYVFGFSANCLYIYLAARLIQSLRLKLNFVVSCLKLISLLTLLVLISTFPRHFSYTFSAIHDYLGIALFLANFALSLWLVNKAMSKSSLSLILIEAFGSVVGLLSIIKVVHFLFIGQIIGALGFALLLCLVLPKVVNGYLSKRKNLVDANN